jgi:formylglycine-generating enzyme required for sulfatase activity
MKSTCLIVCIFAAFGFLRITPANFDETAEAQTPAADPLRGNEPGEVRDDNGLKMQLVWCPPGVVTMENVARNTEPVAEPVAEKENEQNDSDDEFEPDAVDSNAEPAPEPRKFTEITPVKAFLTQGYWLGRHEVTQSEWKRVMQSEPWKGKRFTKRGEDFPATYIDWNDATGFCRKLTEQERQAKRLPNDWEYTLPTEAQWERACRARTDTKFSFGDDESKLGDYAWFGDNTSKAGEGYAHPVGQKMANPWGLFDMHGNVWEWCRDIYVDKLPGGRDPWVKPDERTGGSGGSVRVYRGGSWYFVASGCRSAFRLKGSPDYRCRYLGFRLALTSVR